MTEIQREWWRACVALVGAAAIAAPFAASADSIGVTEGRSIAAASTDPITFDVGPATPFSLTGLPETTGGLGRSSSISPAYGLELVATPEPFTAALFGLGLAGLAVMGRRKSS